MLKSFVYWLTIAAACFVLSACAFFDDHDALPDRPRENPVLSAFLEKQGFVLGITGEEAKLKYNLSSLVDQRDNMIVLANPDITHRSTDPETVVPVLPTQIGFYDGVVRNDTLIVLQNCVRIEPGIIAPKDAIDAFVKAYGLEKAFEHRPPQRSSTDIVYSFIYHGKHVQLIFRPYYDAGRTLHILTLKSAY